MRLIEPDLNLQLTSIEPNLSASLPPGEDDNNEMHLIVMKVLCQELASPCELWSAKSFGH